jgi:hypothetical protein
MEQSTAYSRSTGEENLCPLWKKEGSLPCSQKPMTGPHLEQAESISHLHTVS